MKSVEVRQRFIDFFESKKHSFISSSPIVISDDPTLLFVNAGIPAIDIIDFNYPNTKTNYWHTVEDTPDKCSAESLSAVGTVVLNYLYQLDGAMK